MYTGDPMRALLALGCLTTAVLAVPAESLSIEGDHSVCSDTNAVPSTRTAACTRVISASKKSDEIRITAYFNRAAANYLDSKLDDAIRDYSIFIGARPRSAVAFHERGLAYLKASKIGDAIADFSKAIRLNKKYAAAYNNRGIAYGRIKNNQKALSDFNTALQLDPLYVRALYNRSMISSINTKYEFAASDLKKAIEIQPYNPELFNQMAWVYLKKGMASEGLQYANRSIGLQPSANAYDTRGTIHEKLGRIDQAIDDYKHALALDHSLGSSTQALKRLLARTEVGKENKEVAFLISELIPLVVQNGRRVDLGRMCEMMKLDSSANCMFDQIALSSDVPNVIDTNGFNVPPDKDPKDVVIFHFGPLVGNFFVVSLDGTLKSAFFRARGIDYSEVALADVRQAFEESIKYWKTNLETIKTMIAAGDIRK